MHNAPITSVSLLPQESSVVVATASHDLTGQLTKIQLDDELGPNSDTEPEATPLASLHLYTAPLSSILANTTGSHLLTASWDSVIGLWDPTVPEEDEVPAEDGVNGVTAGNGGESTYMMKRV